MEVGHAGAVAAGVYGDGGDGVVDAVDDEVAGAALADLKTEEIEKNLNVRRESSSSRKLFQATAKF